KAGVRAFIVEYIPQGCSESDALFYLTDSVEKTLREMALASVNGIGNGILVAGSRGKTKVKELLYRTLLSMQRPVRRSPASWNSAVGVALSLWEIRRDSPDVRKNETIVTEAAIDGPGQAVNIMKCIADSHSTGILTDITDEHDEAFESHQDKVREKLKLFSGCRTIIYNCADPTVGPILQQTFPDRRLVAVDPAALPSDCPSVHYALVKAALQLDSMPRLPIASTRVDITESTDGNTILRNHFTADIRSLESTLDIMRRHLTRAQTPVLVLGRLVEGSRQDACRLAARFGIDNVICVDDASEFTASHPVESFSDSLIVVSKTHLPLPTPSRGMKAGGAAK
ncbi:MAG: hypothetical protein K2F63_06365, partial [Muribaculaceae bacterium]|nr:hypothetical protein [Muribaculaceae bacterium]